MQLDPPSTHFTACFDNANLQGEVPRAGFLLVIFETGLDEAEGNARVEKYWQRMQKKQPISIIGTFRMIHLCSQ